MPAAEPRPARRARLAGRVEQSWAGGRLASIALAPAELLYHAAIGLRNRAYDAGLLRERRAPVPVISVGNLMVGGAGKTPVAGWLVGELLARGERPALLHGGYADDEPELHRRWHAEAPVYAGRDRVSLAGQAARLGATVIVLDDAFQHRRIARDLDLLLVPAETWTERPRLLPRGPWREPLAALGRADIVIVTRKTATPERARAVAAAIADRRDPRRDRVAVAWLRADHWRAFGGAAGRPAGEPVTAVLGIARPHEFLENAAAAGARIATRLVFPDHHRYDATDIARIRAAAGGTPIVTTAKDHVKLEPLAAGLSGWVLEQVVEFDSGADLLAAALTAVTRTTDRTDA